jgi:uncharacterized caspase-like protein
VPSAYAVVIGIEEYHSPDIKNVHHARADAEAIRDLLTQRLAVPSADVTLLLDEDAHKLEIEDQLKDRISALGADDRFYFFYAGHGMWANGRNRLTTWDTKISDLGKTTLDVQKTLLNPLRDSGCKQSLMFVDACATEIFVNDDDRDLVSDLDRKEFEQFIAESEYTAAFFACSAKEKSYSTNGLGHGIWTHHLLQALRGENKKALVKGQWITGESLRDYLKDAVPKYIRKHTNIKGHQTPYALIGASGTFKIVKIEAKKKAADELQLQPDFAGAYFRGRETRSFKSLPGFSTSKRHRVPESVNDAADGWARKLLKDEIAEDAQEVYEQAREVLDLPPGAVDKQEHVGIGSVDTELFRYDVYAGQNNEDHTEAAITREIKLRVPHVDLPEEFDDIFPGKMDEVVLPLPGSKGNFAKLVNAVAATAKKIKAKEWDNPTKELIELRLSDGTVMVLDTKNEVVIVRCAGANGCLSMIENLSGDELRQVMGEPPELIGSPPSD